LGRSLRRKRRPLALCAPFLPLFSPER
jgi:hypothetical protein